MLCPQCGAYLSDDAFTCSACGALVIQRTTRTEGVSGIRQGRKGGETPPTVAPQGNAEVRFFDDFSRAEQEEDAPAVQRRTRARSGAARYERDAGRPTHRKGLPATGEGEVRRLKARQAKVRTVQKHMVNWTMVWLCVIVFFLLALVGGYLYLNKTAAGQRILVRLGRSADSQALWQVGEEYLDSGNVTKAVEAFEQARAQDGEEEINVDGLLLLASAYEVDGRLAEAEALYTQLYTDVAPSRPEPYRNMIRILLASDRQPQAGELMQLAYEKTDLATFRQQRNDLLPQIPVVDLTAGTYSDNKRITLTSPQGYDIYYTFQADAVLPQEGILFTEPILLEEGSYQLRAVCVSGTLVSDPLTGAYKVVMPSPQAPRTSLAPATYQQRQRIWLKPGLENEKDTDITIYYTIDGSNPDADSPVYTGEPFKLPGGKVTLKAVAVNRYGKASNTLEVLYKIEAKPYPLKAYSVEDTFSGFTLMQTTRESFLEQHPCSNPFEEARLEGIDEACQKYVYDWGHAVMAKGKSGWYVAQVYMTSGVFSGPRGLSLGASQTAVVDKFRDMGQVASPSGNRGLYANTDGAGKIRRQQDGSSIVCYTAQTTDSHTWTLEYLCDKGGSVWAIRHTYTP